MSISNNLPTVYWLAQCKRWMDWDWIGIHQSTNPRLIHWWRKYRFRSNSYPFIALLRQRRNVLITVLTIRWHKRGKLVHLCVKWLNNSKNNKVSYLLFLLLLLTMPLKLKKKKAVAKLFLLLLLLLLPLNIPLYL